MLKYIMNRNMFSHDWVNILLFLNHSCEKALNNNSKIYRYYNFK